MKFIFILSFIFLFFEQNAWSFRPNTGFWRNSCSLYGPNVNVDGIVSAIATDGTTTYLGGNFSSVQGVSRKNIAAIDSNGNVLPFNPNVNGAVNALQLSGTTLYAGGNFTVVNKPWLNSSGAEINSVGEVNSTFPEVSGTIHVAIPDGSGGWYIGGSFYTVGGSNRSNLARINADGMVHSFNPSADGQVYTLWLSGSTLYVGGAFTNIGGQTRNRIAALDTNSNSATD